jgi:hypothetical protein
MRYVRYQAPDGPRWDVLDPAMVLEPPCAIIGPGEAIVHPRRSARVVVAEA